MKYFIDSAKMDEIKYAYENWAIEGITTNPKHIAAAGKPFYTIVKELAAEFEGIDIPISLEINPHLTDPLEMVEEAKKLAAVSPNFVIKIPCNEAGLIAALKLKKEEIKTNVTLVFTASQALQAARVGATFCSPFIGWQEDSGVDCTQLIQDIVTMYKHLITIPRLSSLPFVTENKLRNQPLQVQISLLLALMFIRIAFITRSPIAV